LNFGGGSWFLEPFLKLYGREKPLISVQIEAGLFGHRAEQLSGFGN
jgi:hypothetical protein